MKENNLLRISKLYLTGRTVRPIFLLNKNGITSSSTLNYGEANGTYYNNSLLIENDKNYKLEVNAVVDGNQLYTESETIAPKDGFKVLKKDLGDIKYTMQRAHIEFEPGPA